jgi:hypothetical protein
MAACRGAGSIAGYSLLIRGSRHFFGDPPVMDTVVSLVTMTTRPLLLSARVCVQDVRLQAR